MASLSFDLSQYDDLSDEQRQQLRRHYLSDVKAENAGAADLHKELNQIYGTVDELMQTEKVERLISLLHTSAHVVLFATEASQISLIEFQLGMRVEGRKVRLVTEDSSDVNGIGALSPNDLLIVVTTSNGFARRQRTNIIRSQAHKVIVTASDDPELHSHFDEVLSMGTGAEEGTALHRIYATYGVSYLFDRLFSKAACTYDPEV